MQFEAKNSIEENKTDISLISKQEILSVMAKFFSSKDFIAESYHFTKYPNLNSLSFESEQYHLKIIATDVRRGLIASPEDYIFFAKKLPSSPAEHKEKTPKMDMFLKETELYSKVFADLAAARGPQPLNTWSPKCYCSRQGEILILEDMIESGYYQQPRREPLSKEQLFAALRALAVLHAASINFEEKGKKTVLDSYEQIGLQNGLDSYPGKVFIKAAMNGQLGLLELLPGYSPAEIKTVKEELPKLQEQILGEAKLSTR